MKKFMVLYMMPKEAREEMMKSFMPEKQQASMAKWMGWIEAHKDSLIEGGSPLGKNMRIRKEGAQMESNEIGGYSIVQAESQEAVTALMEDNPTLMEMSGGYIEVMEIKSM